MTQPHTLWTVNFFHLTPLLPTLGQFEHCTAARTTGGSFNGNKRPCNCSSSSRESPRFLGDPWSVGDCCSVPTRPVRAYCCSLFISASPLSSPRIYCCWLLLTTGPLRGTVSDRERRISSATSPGVSLALEISLSSSVFPCTVRSTIPPQYRDACWGSAVTTVE